MENANSGSITDQNSATSMTIDNRNSSASSNANNNNQNSATSKNNNNNQNSEMDRNLGISIGDCSLTNQALNLDNSTNHQQNYVNELKRKHLSDITPQINQTKKRCTDDSIHPINSQRIQNFAQSTPKTYSRLNGNNPQRPATTINIVTSPVSPVQSTTANKPNQIIYLSNENQISAVASNKVTNSNSQSPKNVQITSPQANKTTKQIVIPTSQIQANKSNQTQVYLIPITKTVSNPTTGTATVPTSNAQAQNVNKQLTPISSSNQLNPTYCLLNSQSPISYIQVPNSRSAVNQKQIDYPLILSPISQFINSQISGIEPIEDASSKLPKKISNIDPQFAKLKQEIEDNQKSRSREALFLETLEEKLGDREFFDLKRLVVPELKPNCSYLEYSKWLDSIVFNVLGLKANPNEKDISNIASFLCGQRSFLLNLYEEHDKWSGIVCYATSLINK